MSAKLVLLNLSPLLKGIDTEAANILLKEVKDDLVGRAKYNTESAKNSELWNPRQRAYSRFKAQIYRDIIKTYF